MGFCSGFCFYPEVVLVAIRGILGSVCLWREQICHFFRWLKELGH